MSEQRDRLIEVLEAFDLYANLCRRDEAEDAVSGGFVRWVSAARAETWERAARMLRAALPAELEPYAPEELLHPDPIKSLGRRAKPFTEPLP